MVKLLKLKGGIYYLVCRCGKEILVVFDYTGSWGATFICDGVANLVYCPQCGEELGSVLNEVITESFLRELANIVASLEDKAVPAEEKNCTAESEGTNSNCASDAVACIA